MVSCDKVPSLPVISFNVGGRSYALTGEQYVLKVRLSGHHGGAAPPPAGGGEEASPSPTIDAVSTERCII